MAFNASDTRHFRSAKAAAKQAAEARTRVLHRLMGDPEGRAFVHDLLSSVSVFHTPFTGIAAGTDYNCGRQSVGLELMADIVAAAPDQYIQMMRERADKDQADGRRYPSPTDTNTGPVGDSPDAGGGDSGPISDYDPTASDAEAGRDDPPN